MLFGICPSMSFMPKFWHTNKIKYNNFMIIVEPWGGVGKIDGVVLKKVA